MKWREMRKSDNVEDVRGAGRRIGGPAAVGGLGLGGILLALLFSFLTGSDPSAILSGIGGGAAAPQAGPQEAAPINDETSDYVRAVLGDTEQTWNTIFAKQLNASYPAPKLVLFDGGIQSACGVAETQSGPFYCPVDEKVYLDMGFFRQIQATSGADADFARAYAISHEVGHHIQHKLGLLDKVRQRQQVVSKEEGNALQVRVELQADCFAGVWGHYTAKRNLIDRNDLKVAMQTAAQIGDDYLQKKGRGYVVPESFTHGSSEQRVEWFTTGLKSGDINSCDTFQ
jgi:uncharacterized protein